MANLFLAFITRKPSPTFASRGYSLTINDVRGRE